MLCKRFNHSHFTTNQQLIRVIALCIGYPRDCLGGGTVAGDLRWCGAYGVQADFIARSHCSVEIISTADIQVTLCLYWVWLNVIIGLDQICHFFILTFDCCSVVSPDLECLLFRVLWRSLSTFQSSAGFSVLLICFRGQGPMLTIMMIWGQWMKVK